MYRLFLILFLIAGLLSSCMNGGKSGEQLARVHDKYLYESDLQGLFPPGTSSDDSTVIVNRFIENWVRQQIYLYEAEKNLSADMPNIQRKIDDYRNSLLIFTYENEIISKNLDTLITDQLLEEYYEQHQDEFRLRESIVKLNFVKLPVDAPDINQVRRLIRSDDMEDIVKLEEYSLNHAAAFFLDQESWFVFSDILREIPLNPSNHESFLRNNRFIELNDEFYRYFLYIRDYKLEGSSSPLIFEVDNIKAIILNHRKQALINEFRQNLYKEAIGNGVFEIY